MVNRMLKREIRFWAQMECRSEVSRCLGQVVKTRGFRGAQTLIDKIFRHQPAYSEDRREAAVRNKEFVFGVLDNMNEEKRVRDLRREPLLDEGGIPANAQLQSA